MKHLKHLVLTTCFLALVLFCPSAFAAPPEAGDVDMSGGVNAVNAIDVQLVINAALGIEIDSDGDGLCDIAEGVLGTNPASGDTDGDGVGDFEEVVAGTDPGTVGGDTDEDGLPDDWEIAEFGDLSHCGDVDEEGDGLTWYDYIFDDPAGPDDPDDWINWRDVNNWALVKADALAYAYKHTGHDRFLNAAGQFYATGTIDPQWEDDPNEYVDTKGIANACSWGLVYMNQSR